MAAFQWFRAVLPFLEVWVAAHGVPLTDTTATLEAGVDIVGGHVFEGA